MPGIHTNDVATYIIYKVIIQKNAQYESGKEIYLSLSIF